MLERYAEFLISEALDDVASEYLRLLVEHEVPLLRVIAHLPDEGKHAVARDGIARFLGDLAARRAIASAQESMRKWEADELEVVSKDDISASDLVGIYGAQKSAIIHFMPRFTDDPHVVVTMVAELEAFFMQVQSAAFGLYARMREEAADRIAELARELGREKRFIESMVAHVPASILYLDRDLVMRWFNPAYEQSVRGWGVDPQTLLNRPFLETIAAQRDRIEPLLRRVLDSGEAFSAVGFPTVTRANGVPVTHYWDFNYVPVRDENGAVIGVLSLSIEATGRVEQERYHSEKIAALESADRMKDQFLSIVSHELRTPINAIMGFASILDDEVAGPLSGLQHQYMGRILGGSEILLSLINDLLDMSRIQAGKFTLHTEPVEMAWLVAEVVGHIRPLAEHKNHRLSVDVPDGLPKALGDPQRIRQVWTNLLGNAVKFTPEGGEITVRVRVADGWLRCEVKDTGVGIAEADLPRLFRRFEQLDASSTRSAGGTGLGLSITKVLVESQGGAIGVESAPGAGSTFWFTLPLAEA